MHEVHLFHRSLECTFGLAENFETSTSASTSSVGELQLCLLYVLFVVKLSKPVLSYFLVQEHGTLGLVV